MMKFHYSDEVSQNIHLVTAIRQEPEIYDHTLPGYNNKELQEQAWQRIADSVGDPVATCKNRWMSLRGSLCRHIRQSMAGKAGTPKKPYYMAKHMAFLIPFTKVRLLRDMDGASSASIKQLSTSLESASDDPMGRLEDLQNKYDLSDTTGHAETHNDLDRFPPDFKQEMSELVDDYDFSYEGGLPIAKRAKIDQIIATADENSSLDNGASDNSKLESPPESFPLITSVNENPDPDVSFLMSLVPDMKKLEDNKKSGIKIKILQLIHNELYESN